MELKDTIEVKSGMYEIDYLQKDNNTIQVLRPIVSEEELLTRDPYQEMIEKASELEEFNKAKDTQQMISDYLIANNEPTIASIKAKSGKTEILGILTHDHKVALQRMANQYCQEKMGTSINEIMRKHNAPRQILGILSIPEKTIIDEMLESYRLTKENTNKTM